MKSLKANKILDCKIIGCLEDEDEVYLAVN